MIMEMVVLWRCSYWWKYVKLVKVAMAVVVVMRVVVVVVLRGFWTVTASFHKCKRSSTIKIREGKVGKRGRLVREINKCYTRQG